MSRFKDLRYGLAKRRAYLGLCYRVFKINRKAAWHLLTDVRKTKSFTYENVISCCVTWADTKQGWRYWNNIHDALEKDNA